MGMVLPADFLSSSDKNILPKAGTSDDKTLISRQWLTGYRQWIIDRHDDVRIAARGATLLILSAQDHIPNYSLNFVDIYARVWLNDSARYWLEDIMQLWLNSF